MGSQDQVGGSAVADSAEDDCDGWTNVGKVNTYG